MVTEICMMQVIIFYLTFYSFMNILNVANDQDCHQSKNALCHLITLDKEVQDPKFSKKYYCYKKILISEQFEEKNRLLSVVELEIFSFLFPNICVFVSSIFYFLTLNGYNQKIYFLLNFFYTLFKLFL